MSGVYAFPSNGSLNGNKTKNYGGSPYGAPIQQQTQQSQQPQVQQPQLHPQQSQQSQQPQQQQQQQQHHAGVNQFLGHVSQPTTALASSQPQMAMVAASQPTNQWSVQPPQQQCLVQQPAQNQYGTASIPPYQGPDHGQTQGQRQMTQSFAHQVQHPSYGSSYRAPSAYRSNQNNHPSKPQQQQQGLPPQPPAPVPILSDDFFGDFTSQPQRSMSSATDYTGPASVIQTGGNDNDNVSVLSKNTTDNRAKTKKVSPLDDPNFAPRPPPISGIENAKSIAAHADPSADPLPNFDKVTHSGYALARISFRAILIKKWKQIFWVTYGASKILIFRSHADFEDWMSNPYLTKGQRDFLIKLEVDFIEDAYKVNVRGYQVTNIRCKNYQSKNLHQFKLERWMDYGPTIAAAFASQSEKDVLTLRIILSEMMKNCPQDRGLGAVTSHNEYNTRTHDSNNGYGNEAHNYNESPGRHYISGSASAGAASENGSKSGRSIGGVSTGALDRIRNLSSRSSGTYRK